MLRALRRVRRLSTLGEKAPVFLLARGVEGARLRPAAQLLETRPAGELPEPVHRPRELGLSGPPRPR